MANQKTNKARAELQAWYLNGLLPKLGDAVTRGAVDLREIEAFDAEVRALLDLSRTREEAA